MQSVNEQTNKLIYGFTNPMDSGVQRFRDKFTSRPTAVAKPFSRLNAKWDADAETSYNQIPNDTYCAFLFRDIFRSMIRYVANPTHTAWGYDFVFTDGTSSSEDASTLTFWSPYADFIDIPILWGVPNIVLSQLKPHGDYQYPGYVGSSTLLWLDTLPAHPSSIQIELNAASIANNDVILLIEKFVNGVFEPSGTVGSTLGSNTMSLPLGSNTSGYYRFRAKITGGVKISFMNTNCTVGSFGHSPAGTLDQCLAAVSDHRVISASIMYSNESAVLYKQGTATIIQQGNNKPWYETALIPYSEFAEYNNSKQLSLVDGIYGWLKPTGPSDFSMKRGVHVNNGVIVRAAFDLGSVSDYIALMCNCPADLGKIGKITACHHVEFETLDNWRNQAPAFADPVAFDEALLILSNTPQFSSNANHLGAFLSKLKSYAKNGANYVASNAPKIMDLVMKYGPQVAKTAATVASIL